MILRDPVHGLVSFEGWAERVVSRLLLTREVQRLRRVRQLGLTSLVFPGAEHSRFSHGLGAAHVMMRLQERLGSQMDALPAELRLTPADRADGLAAALVHDLGHGPFSHLYEEVLPGAISHEAWTQQILRDPGTDVHRALEELDPNMANRVADLLAGESRLGYLGRAVSGMVDVDRADYLLRDSHMTGARYGLYDLEWLLEAFCFAQTPSGDWVLAVEGRKGLPPIEGFFLGRHFMYRQVYHHKATRAAECLIRGLFQRMAELVRQGSSPTFLPRALRHGALAEPVALGDYLELDDALLLTCFAAWEKEKDPILSSLAGRLRARRLPKTIPLEGSDRREALARATEVVKAKGRRVDYSLWLDITSDTPYAEPEDGSGGLWVTIRHRPIARLGDVSFLLGELRNKRIEAGRLIFLEEDRAAVLRAIEGVLG
ncbi:MAG: HD domain-containing protein [Myxococcota bacterium]